MLTCALQSGSNGNAIYVEADGVRLLFDAGLSARQAQLRLQPLGRSLLNLDAILISHGHSDHTRGAGVLHRKSKAPLYVTPATHRVVRQRCGTLTDVKRFQPGDVLKFGAVLVHTLPTPHDFPDSVAFVIEHAGRRLGVLTDLGHAFDRLRDTLPTLDAAYLESNYDPQMLAAGDYPPELKERITGDQGHLSNHDAADLLRNCPRRLQWAALSHLSEHNNTPELALATHRAALGAEYPLHVMSRYEASPLMSV